MNRRNLWKLGLLLTGVVVLVWWVAAGGGSALTPYFVVLGVATALFGLALPSTAAGLVGAVIMGVWCVGRAVNGLWLESEVVQIAIEIGLLAWNLLVAIRIRLNAEHIQKDIRALGDIRTLLAIDQTQRVLSDTLGKLRLNEEIDRAQHFQRPLSLLIVECLIDTAHLAEDSEEKLRRAVERMLSARLSAHDIPFVLGNHAIAVILPERDLASAFALAHDLEAATHAAALPLAGLARLGDKVTLAIGVSGMDQQVRSAQQMIEYAIQSVGATLIPTLSTRPTMALPVLAKAQGA
jgi:GGDEF domain-containing protein